MVEFAAKCEFFSQQYDTRFSDQCKRTLALHSISLLLVLILWYSEVCLKAISRAKKSAMEMKIGQIVHHTLLFFQAIAALGISCLRLLLQRIKIWLGCKKLDFEPP